MKTRKVHPFDSSPVTQEVTVILQKGCSLEGRLRFEGTARIDGELKGEIFTPDILILGEDARVQGQVEAEVVVIAGHFDGEILATQRIEIQAGAIVKGVVKTAMLQIEEGAIFDGKTKMLGPNAKARQIRETHSEISQ